jgi:hypothetical protein
MWRGKRRLEPVEVELATLGANLREQAQQLAWRLIASAMLVHLKPWMGATCGAWPPHTTAQRIVNSVSVAVRWASRCSS